MLRKDGKQAIDVLARGNAPEQDHVARGRRQHLSRTLQGASEPTFIGSHRHADKFAKVLNSEPSFRRKQSAGWGDNLHPCHCTRRLGEVLPIRELSAEVQPAAKSKDIAEFRIANPDLSRQFKGSFRTSKQLCTTAAGASRGKHEDTIHSCRNYPKVGENLPLSTQLGCSRVSQRGGGTLPSEEDLGSSAGAVLSSVGVAGIFSVTPSP